MGRRFLLLNHAKALIVRETFHLQGILRQEGHSKVKEVVPELRALAKCHQTYGKATVEMKTQTRKKLFIF